MQDPVERLDKSSRLENLGSDIRTVAGGSDKPVYLRVRLANEVASLLSQGKNVLLKGGSGCGKTALVHSLPHARWPTTETGQLRLVDTRSAGAPRIIETHAARFIDGCHWCHELENKMSKQLDAARTKPAIVFIENIDECIGLGSSSSDPHTDVANLLCPHLDKGLRVIGTTTPEGESRMRSENERLLSRFVTLDVPPPDEEESAEIAELYLAALRKKGLLALPDAAAVGLSLAERFLAASPPLAGFIRLAARAAGFGQTLGPHSFKKALVEETGLLPSFVGAASPLSVLELRAQLSLAVFGQDDVVDEIADALVRLQGGLTEPGRPAAAYLCAGPTGCGKTSAALATAKALTGSEESCIRFDMSEYLDPFSPQRLIAENPTSLVGRLRAAPAGVVLFDEIEKAHPLVRLLLLQALGEARITSVEGKTVRLDNHIVMLTTNVGSRRWLSSDTPEKAAALVLCDCAEEFPPEFLGRMTRTLVFRPLDSDTSRRIVVRELNRVNDLPGLAERALQITWSEPLVDALSVRGVSVEKGARGLQVLVRTAVVSPLARWIAENPHARNGLVSLSPRLESGEMVSLVVDWLDETGFFAGTLN